VLVAFWMVDLCVGSLLQGSFEYLLLVGWLFSVSLLVGWLILVLVVCYVVVW
jgi:hypothetical protein